MAKVVAFMSELTMAVTHIMSTLMVFESLRATGTVVMVMGTSPRLRISGPRMTTSAGRSGLSSATVSQRIGDALGISTPSFCLSKASFTGPLGDISVGFGGPIRHAIRYVNFAPGMSPKAIESVDALMVHVTPACMDFTYFVIYSPYAVSQRPTVDISFIG
jgi:hypothetical protein